MANFGVTQQKVLATKIDGVFVAPLSLRQLNDLQAKFESDEFKELQVADQLFAQLDALLRDSEGNKFDNLSSPEDVEAFEPFTMLGEAIQACLDTLTGTIQGKN